LLEGATQAPTREHWLSAVDRQVVWINRALMIAALAAMSVIVFANVMLRYLTDASIVWSEEVARYLMIWLTFLGVGPVLRLGGHIAIDTLQEALPPRAAQALRVVIVGLIALLCLAVIWYGWALVQRTAAQTTPVTEVSFSIVSAAVPTGFALALWHLVAVARGFVRDNAFEVSSDLGRDEAGSV
jgi:TRAP-type C4-dicarboxylate transport system permease small subunit